MNKLKCYILGMVTIVVAMPIMEQIAEIICGSLEILKGKNTKKILKINKEIEDWQIQLEPLEPINTNCIGFEIPSQDNYDEDWEEYNKNKKNKIGFI